MLSLFTSFTHTQPIPPKKSLLHWTRKNPRHTKDKEKKIPNNPSLCTVKKKVINRLYFRKAKKTSICQKVLILEPLSMYLSKKEYKCYHPTSKIFFVSIDVVFHESWSFFFNLIFKESHLQKIMSFFPSLYISHIKNSPKWL